ncbi:YiiX/YebB-like N1pC/P60 family cysteine hydrolase [Domibacillus sp. 8LH]|uniref:YiiX/YebB-like N1pC/P60 family cysteine hydrolase n=1 Tax=unclassified Domibacillus TaxID=2632383 RepID=UPI0028ED504F|nr:YiiX/YebB-like N1pC/P60 family cysteine hydrolase [Domibacillus sp. DTU_2020_1001157_1_SI_ALB_TIR_016]WNS79447.1 YiiX/YebB-like N1pC/P60 family cysteine hydrolase [Domibacillus sp. DTU_2020_1001157_1_SI_ALB_TIR_016]
MSSQKFNGIIQIPYSQAVSKIQTGDLLFCSGTSLISEFIKKASNSLMSHVAFLVRWHGRILVFESIESAGVRVIPLAQYVKGNRQTGEKYKGALYIARHKTLIDSSFDRRKLHYMIGKALDLLHQNYDQAELVRILTRIKLGIGRHKENEEYICSEFVDLCFKQIGVEFPRTKEGFIYPEHIAADPNVYPMFQMVPDLSGERVNATAKTINPYTHR